MWFFQSRATGGRKGAGKVFFFFFFAAPMNVALRVIRVCWFYYSFMNEHFHYLIFHIFYHITTTKMYVFYWDTKYGGKMLHFTIKSDLLCAVQNTVCYSLLKPLLKILCKNIPIFLSFYICFFNPSIKTDMSKTKLQTYNMAIHLNWQAGQEE